MGEEEDEIQGEKHDPNPIPTPVGNKKKFCLSKLKL